MKELAEQLRRMPGIVGFVFKPEKIIPAARFNPSVEFHLGHSASMQSVLQEASAFGFVSETVQAPHWCSFSHPLEKTLIMHFNDFGAHGSHPSLFITLTAKDGMNEEMRRKLFEFLEKLRKQAKQTI